MRGCIVKRKTKGCYALVLSERRTNPATGSRKLWQKWMSFKGTRDQANTKMADLVSAFGRGEFVEPSRITVAEWLRRWLKESVEPAKRTSTVVRYTGIIENHIIPVLGGIRLQALRPGHVESYFAVKRAETNVEGSKTKLGNGSLGLHRVVLFSALKKAVRAGIVPRNIVELVDGVPRVQRQHDDLLRRCWAPDEALRFLAAAKASGPQDVAFYRVALECGLRKGELCGLQWSDLDLDACTLKVLRTLLQAKDKTTGEPVFGSTKTGDVRTINLSDDAVQLLREHRRTQAELKIRNRILYHDHGLVFAKDWQDVTRRRDVLGDALQINNLGQRSFAKLIKAANVRSIRFHDLRHTAATLMLQAGVPAKVVQERLGHKRIEMTLNIYAHVLPAMQQEAAMRMAAVLSSR
jgi:integrase